MNTNAAVNSTPSERLQRLLGYLAHSPDNLNLLIESLVVARDEKVWDTLRHLLNSALSYYPDSPEVNAHAGLFDLQNNDFSAAKQRLVFATEQGVNSPAVKLNLAISYYYSHDFERADELLSNIEKDESIKRDLAVWKARVLHHKECYDEAMCILQANLEEEGEPDYEALSLLSLIISDSGDYEGALPIAKAAAQKNMPHVEALIALGDIYLQKADYSQSYVFYKDATIAYPTSGRSWSGRGTIEFYEFEIDQAISSLETAVKHMPNHIGTWHILAWAQLMKGNIEAAHTAFQKAYDIDNNFAESHGGLASIFAIEGNIEQAQKHIRIATRIDKNCLSATYAKMVLRNQQGKESESHELFESFKDRIAPQSDRTIRSIIESRMAEMKSKHNSH